MIYDDDKSRRDELDRQIRANLRRLLEEDSDPSADDRFARLIEKIRQQDEAQQDDKKSEAYRRIEQDILAALPDLRGFARSLTKDPLTAEDLVQETVVKAITNLEKFELGTNLRAWLFTILRNYFYTTKRKGKREVQDADGVEAAKLIQIPNQEARLAFQEFRAAFQTLPTDQREALMLVGVSGFSYEEAAATCGCAVGTIKSRVNRGRARLADVMGVAKGESFGSSGISPQPRLI